jgi:hypothetical protein
LLIFPFAFLHHLFLSYHCLSLDPHFLTFKTKHSKQALNFSDRTARGCFLSPGLSYVPAAVHGVRFAGANCSQTIENARIY